LHILKLIVYPNNLLIRLLMIPLISLQWLKPYQKWYGLSKPQMISTYHVLNHKG